MISINTNNSITNITAIKAFNDNYIWALSNGEFLVLVDPGDADVCIDFIEQNKLKLDAILITHHHSDHTGGVQTLVDYAKQNHWPLTVYGPANEALQYSDLKLSEGDWVKLDNIKVNLQVIELPGHTLGHIAYVSKTDSKPVLFCGDTLFSAGCGRLFEGSPEQMLSSLKKLANLPDSTQVYCAHEYTQANLAFALTVEPENQALKDYNDKVATLRNDEQSTIPTNIAVEKRINPFLRCHKQSLQASAMDFNSSDNITELETFTAIRRWKDQF